MFFYYAGAEIIAMSQMGRDSVGINGKCVSFVANTNLMRFAFLTFAAAGNGDRHIIRTMNACSIAVVVCFIAGNRAVNVIARAAVADRFVFVVIGAIIASCFYYVDGLGSNCCA